MKKQSRKWYQQGDVTITPMQMCGQHSIPKKATPVTGRTLREGEATGHAHVATAEDVRLFQLGGILYLRTDSGTEIVHEEHRAITIPAGDYVVGVVREYDHFAEEARQVID